MGNVIGMVFVEKLMVEWFNIFGKTVVDYYIYVIVGDGDLMEGVVVEVVFLVGHF